MTVKMYPDHFDFVHYIPLNDCGFNGKGKHFYP